MTPLRWGLALSGWAVWAVVTFLPDAVALRTVLVTAFLLVCPGLAASRWARPGAVRGTDRTAVLETGVLSVTVGVSMAVLVVEALFLGGAFTVTRALLALAVATCVLALLPRRGVSRRGTPRAAPEAGARPADAGRAEPPASE